ncbi:MAG: hypothetical protein KBA26_01820 [Candidatus Delongbacteria bacterium]|nr:hypothetical protein [Candidatus Delongbacteria bacterium]
MANDSCIFSCLDYIKRINQQNEVYLDQFFVSLFHQYLKNPQTIMVEFKDTKQDPDYRIDIGVIAPDWPGMIETISGYLHNAEFNINFTHGFQFPYQDQKKAFIFFRMILQPHEYDRFQFQKVFLKSIIERATLQSAPISYLISQEVQKLEVYEEVIAMIRNRCAKELADDLIREKGEVIKFFTNRTKAYISERIPGDLCDQIINNYRFYKSLKDNSEFSFFYHVKNLQTIREKLTGISVATREGKVNLNMVLAALRKSVPRFIIRYIKKYMVDDIAIIRIEINDPAENWYGPEWIRRIETAFETLRNQGYLLSLESFDKIGGFEQYGRAIIPILRNECEKTGIPQFYFSLENRQEYFVEFKLIVVHGFHLTDTINFAISFAVELSRIPGFHIFKISPASRMNQNELNIVDLRVETELWSKSEEIYGKIKEILCHYLPKYRDFDEGMRVMDNDKLDHIIQHLTEFPQDILIHFYYHLNEFYRISAFMNEILAVIRNSIRLHQDMISRKLNFGVRAEQLVIQLENHRIITSGSVFYVAYRLQNERMTEILTILTPYEVIFSRVDFESVTVLIAILKQKHTALNVIEFIKVKRKLEIVFEK